MSHQFFKVHTNDCGRLCACIQKAMYGVSKTAITTEMPKELLSIREGDMVFISEREVSKNALFGPFYVVAKREGIVPIRQKGMWQEIDEHKSTNFAYWVTFEKMNWCILFDRDLIDRVSIVWPYNWKSLNVDLPAWGLVPEAAASKLVNFAVGNQREAQDFLNLHCRKREG